MRLLRLHRTGFVLGAACLVLTACDRFVEAEAEAVRTGVTEIESAFIALFEEAYLAGDVDAALRLVELSGAADAKRTEAKFRVVFSQAFERRIRRMWFRPPGSPSSLEYMHAGTRYRPNLPVVGTFVIEFDVADPASATSATLPVGRTDDGLRFITSVPVM